MSVAILSMKKLLVKDSLRVLTLRMSRGGLGSIPSQLKGVDDVTVMSRSYLMKRSRVGYMSHTH